MVQLNFMYDGETRITVDAPPGISIMRAALDAGIPGIIGTCGGNATCLTCHCYVDDTWFSKVAPPDAHEKTMLDVLLSSLPNSRLTCQINITEAYEGLTLEVPDFQG